MVVVGRPLIFSEFSHFRHLGGEGWGGSSDPILGTWENPLHAASANYSR